MSGASELEQPHIGATGVRPLSRATLSGVGARQRYLSWVVAQQGVSARPDISCDGIEVIQMATIKKTVKVLPGQTKKVKTGNVTWTIKRGR